MGDPMSQRGPLKGKIVNLRVKFLDDNVHAFQISIKALGNALWEAVVRHLQLVESDYFDLQYDDTRGLRCWLDHEKGLLKQLPSPDSPLDFCVKFYTPDPGLLDEFTRYLYALQIKKDLGTGHMVCSENTAALLASYIVQAEFGDFIIEEYTDHSYLMSIPPFIPRQSDSLLRKVMEYHKQHIGETPAEAEASLVDVARKVETYGIRLNAAKDHEGVALYLAVAHLGILVFQNNTKINTFSWAKIRKLSFKRKKFLIKLHPETYGYYKDTVEFFYESRDESKNFWKQCIEHHAFFRCHMIKKIPRNKTKLVSRGSSFRYSGRTQKQLMTYVRETCVKSPSFQRSVSGRISSASRSTSVTPKIPAKMTMNNSTDTHNSTASSGSHILSTGADTPHDRTEVVDVHSAGSSLSGSRSLGSPKPDHSSTPDGTIDTKAYLVGGGEEPVPSLYERGAHSNLVITNAIVTHNQNMSTNQNPTDNDQSDLLLTGGGRQLSADKDMYTINEVENRLDKINSELSRQNIENVPDSYREKLYSSLGKESKKVVFAAEVGKAGESSNESNGNLEQEEVQGQSKVLSSTEPEHDLQAETQREIEDLIASVQEEKRKLAEGERSEVNNEKSFIIQLKDEVPAGSCITVSVGVSSSRQNSPDKHFAPDIASQNSMDSIDLDHTGHTSTECDSYSFSSLANSEDLFDTIPYILHRRHFSEDADEENDIVSPVEPSIQFHSLRRSRSLKKKRPTNIQVEQVKVYAGSEDGSPSPQLHQRSFSCGTKRSHQSRSPSEKGIQILNSRSPSGKRTPNTPSSHEQSPAGGGRRNYFTLPPRDSFSSIDDTASPDFEKDIIKYIKDHHLDDLCDIVSGSEMKLGLNEIEPESYLFSKPVVESKELKNSENNFETADAECNSYSDKSINNNQSNNGVKNKAEKKSKNGQNGKSKSGTNNGVERKNKQKQSDNEKSNSEQLQSKAKNKKKLKNGNGAKKIETVDLIEKHPISSDDGSLDFPSPAAVFLLTEDLPPPYPGIVSKPPHALRPEDRKLSAPVFGTKEYQSARDRQNDNRLSRCDEIENIPTSIQEEPSMSDFHISVNRTVSETDNSHLEDREDSPPPPPPPPPLEDDIPFTPPNYRSTPQRDYDHGTSILSEHEGPRSNVSVLSSSRTEDSEDDHKKKAKRHLVDRAYYIAKELLMTERTYKKDLEVITVFFRNAASNEDNVPECLVTLFSYLVPMYEFHCEFLKELDQRLSMWYVYPPSKFNIPDEKEHSCIREGKTNAHMNGDYQRIGDILNNNFNFPVLNMYKNYIDHVENLLAAVQETMKKDKMFDHMYKEFESQKVCYLPLNTFFLKPGQRLLHYRLILERITKHYSLDHHDYPDCDASLKKISDVVSECKEKMRLEENLQKLIELQRDMIGIESIVHPDRKFVREGCLQKFSRKGYQQRMFFLFSDILLYSSRTASSLLQFKVHGQLPLRGMIVEESDHAKMAVANSFAIYGGNKCILVAASSQEEKDKWIEDLNEAIIAAKNRNDDKLKYASLKSSTSSSENVDNGDTHEMNGHIPEKQIQHRANTTMHVCWHRNTSVSLRDHDKSVKNQMSGYLLRKFKNSNGWQKLWVVFTNFCLFFYKTYQDDFPLASLPLLGYAVNTPDDEDGIHKDHVFKLQFKNHVYFFRAESEYTFERWMEVINSATNSARRIRLFSRLDSQQAS